MYLFFYDLRIELKFHFCEITFRNGKQIKLMMKHNNVNE